MPIALARGRGLGLMKQRDVDARDAARLAAQLARQDKFNLKTVAELAADAVLILSEADKLRRWQPNGALSPDKIKISDALAVYDGALVYRPSSQGMRVGVKWRGASFTAGASDIFYLA